ncbi:hypothetical protein GZH46_00990, partial [Fragariocoptes setiger]
QVEQSIMNIIKFFTTIAATAAAIVMCLSQVAVAGGDKSARTTVITLAGGNDHKGGANYVPVPIPVCQHGYRGHSHGGHGGW